MESLSTLTLIVLSKSHPNIAELLDVHMWQSLVQYLTSLHPNAPMETCNLMFSGLLYMPWSDDTMHEDISAVEPHTTELFAFLQARIDIRALWAVTMVYHVDRQVDPEEYIPALILPRDIAHRLVPDAEAKKWLSFKYTDNREDFLNLALH